MESTSGVTRKVLIVVREAVVIGFFVMVAWAGWRVMAILDNTYLVSLPWLPARVTQSVIPIGAVLFIVAELLSFGPGDHSDDGSRDLVE